MGQGFSKMKKQAKKLQEQFEQIQEEMKQLKVNGSAGNGLVEVVLNGDRELVSIKINPECVDKDDVEALEDLISAAFEDASKKVQENSPSSDLDGLGSMPFGF